MSNILTLETPQELLRIKREYILREIELYGERERISFQEFMHARKARKELESLLFEYDNAIEILDEFNDKEMEHFGGEESVKCVSRSELISEILDNQGYIDVEKTKTVGQYLGETYFVHEGLLERLLDEGYLYLARDGAGDLGAYDELPEKVHAGSWWGVLSDSYDYCRIVDDDFLEVQWSDDEPTKISDLLEIYENGGESGN